MFDNYDEVLTAEEACEALKIGRNILYLWLNTGKIKAFRCGRMWKIPRAALAEFVITNSKLK